MGKILFFGLIFLFHSTASADFYKKLGVLSTASEEEIDKKYKIIEERLRQDQNPDNPELKKRLEELKEARDLLSDPIRRAEYDRKLKEGQADEISHYELLGVMPEASPAQVKEAYRAERSIHPDNHKGNEKEAKDRFIEVQKAYKILQDSRKRFEYDAFLREKHTLLPFQAERRANPKRFKEKAQNRQSRVRARGPQGESPEEWEKAAWNEKTFWTDPVFELAQNLEKEGGETNMEEAVSWYKELAQGKHLESAFRLIFLVEYVGMDEIRYRYEQVKALDSDGALTRDAAFQIAQYYQAGVSKGGVEILTPNPEEASEWYEEAFRLGVSPEEIALEYDKHGAHQKALEWLNKRGGDKAATADFQNPKQKVKELITEREPKEASSALQADPNSEDTFNKLLLEVVPSEEKKEPRMRVWTNYLEDVHPRVERRILRKFRSIFDTGKADLSVRNSKGETALHQVISPSQFGDSDRSQSFSYFKAAQWLVKRNAKVNIPDKAGNSPVHRIALMRETRWRGWGDDTDYAIQNDKRALKMLKILSGGTEKINPQMENNQGKTPLEMAADKGYWRAVHWMLDQIGIPNLRPEVRARLLATGFKHNQKAHFNTVKTIIKETGEHNLSSEEREKILVAAVTASEQGYAYRIILLMGKLSREEQDKASLMAADKGWTKITRLFRNPGILTDQSGGFKDRVLSLCHEGFAGLKK